MHGNNRVRELPCTSETAKHLAEMTHWKPDTVLSLHDIPETFNIDDFCTLVKKEFFKKIFVALSWNTSREYKTAIEHAFDELQNLQGNTTELDLCYSAGSP